MPKNVGSFRIETLVAITSRPGIWMFPEPPPDPISFGFLCERPSQKKSTATKGVSISPSMARVFGSSLSSSMEWRLTPQISRAVPRRRLHLLVRAAQFGSQTRTQVPRIERDKSQHHRKPCQDEHQNRIPRSTPAATDL